MHNCPQLVVKAQCNTCTCISLSNIFSAEAPPMEKKVVTEDIKDLMNLLSGIRKEDVFVFGTFLGISETRLHDIENNYSDDHQRLLMEVGLLPLA